MTKFAALVYCLAFALQASAQSFRLSVQVGTEIIEQKKLLLSASNGVFLTQSNNDGFVAAPHLTVSGEWATEKFHCAAGIGIEKISFGFTARRSAWLQSLHGEYYYEEDEIYTGNQTLVSVPVRADYFFLKSNAVQFGITTGGTFNQIFRYHVTSGYEYSADVKYNYITCNLGPVIEFDFEKAAIGIRPCAQYIVSQSDNKFKSFGALVNFDVAIPFSGKAE
jgi:hypothetical protein